MVMKILILGIGSAQKDAIAMLKLQGHYVIGISFKKEGPALQLVDEFETIDIVDKEKVLSFAEENNVNLVYSIGSDLAMPTVGYVSSKLNRPSFVTEEVAGITQHKALFRAFLNENNISPINFKNAKNYHDLADWNQFPAILKPVDSQGQRGVIKVSDRNELESKFAYSQRFSRTKTVILEQFIDGKEVSVNGYMFNGELKYAFLSDRRVIEGFSGGLVQGHDFPTTMPEKQQTEARKMAQQVAHKLNYLNGPFYFQMIYNRENVFIIEGTPRFDGCHLWKLIKERYAINLLEIAFNHLTGNEIHFPPIVEPLALKNSIEFFVQEPGTIFQSENFAIKNENYSEMYYTDGEMVRPINGEMEKVGYQIISTPL
jgi:phosphoribosylamine-glycine ligase